MAGSRKRSTSADLRKAPKSREANAGPRRARKKTTKNASVGPKDSPTRAKTKSTTTTIVPGRSSRRVVSATAPPVAGDPLTTYRAKRDFSRTPEPRGRTRPKRGSEPCFVIQKHAATALHYDVRLEIDGVLKSWAVPKGPSLNPRDKRLAVETEDHPFEYADFEGAIPDDEYGGGTVIVWDTGRYRNLMPHPMQRCYRDGHIEVWLEGEKVRGGFALIHSRMGGNRRAWLLVKMKDELAVTKTDPLRRKVRSVLSGRTIEEVARDPQRVWTTP